MRDIPAAPARPSAGPATVRSRRHGPTAPGAPGRTATRWAVALLTAAAVVYNDWLLALFLPTGLDPRHSYVSELYAADQPFHVLFGAVEVLAAALVVAGALLALRRPANRWARAGWWSLVGFGVSSVADVVVPMRCAPSVEHPCEAVNPWHTTTSAFVHLALFASMLLLTVGLDAAARPPGPVRRWGPWVLGSALATALATVGALLGHPGWHGVPQRAHLTLVGVWFLLLAVGLRGGLPGAGTGTRRR
ncbi:hypothetical protein GCM10010218_46030 [Streptomyces mashuensis]|uniref:DUF998 domain-containing protein n=1 Tax=Streptomyces mashuensis TaxID=33904 RepID=A0A919B7A4_9ACTN|nr:DUF998 domain-containing protein [Streptomyces mashuensis]GHF59329.1 hypothetical protein GCM10010218_46030 [Streptomyces mashuensis]